MLQYSSTVGSTNSTICGGQHVVCDKDCLHCVRAEELYNSSESTSSSMFSVRIVSRPKGGNYVSY